MAEVLDCERIAPPRLLSMTDMAGEVSAMTLAPTFEFPSESGANASGWVDLLPIADPELCSRFPSRVFLTSDDSKP